MPEPVIVGHSCKAVHARPVAAVLAACRYEEAAACKDGAPALVGVHWLIIHVELEVSAPFECGALRCASRAIHREVVHTLGSDSLCGGWLIPGPHATSRSAAAAGPYQSASRELRCLQGDHQDEEIACRAHACERFWLSQNTQPACHRLHLILAKVVY